MSNNNEAFGDWLHHDGMDRLIAACPTAPALEVMAAVRIAFEGGQQAERAGAMQQALRAMQPEATQAPMPLFGAQPELWADGEFWV